MSGMEQARAAAGGGTGRDGGGPTQGGVSAAAAVPPWMAGPEAEPSREDQPSISYDGRRQSARRRLHCPLELLDESSLPAEGLALSGECLNVSDGGLYGVVPFDKGVRVGRRFTLRLNVPARGTQAGRVVTQRGTVVRVDLSLLNGREALGVAVRWTGRRSGTLPIPSRV